jgi:hypothetical protein
LGYFHSRDITLIDKQKSFLGKNEKLFFMGMNKFYDQMISDFNVFGELDDDRERLEKNKYYKAFIVSLKK